MTELEKFKNKLEKLEKEKNDSIIRIASLTDSVLIEQEQENYNELEESISNIQYQIIQQEHLNYMDYFLNLFLVENDIIKAIILTNKLFQLPELLKENRLRAPKTLNDRKLLIQICEILHYKIFINDLQNTVVDIINNKTREQDEKIECLILYVKCFSRFHKYNKYANDNIIMIPKD